MRIVNINHELINSYLDHQNGEKKT